MTSKFKHYNLSRLELFLGLAVLVGLGYMVYLFSLTGPGTDPGPETRLTGAARTSLSRIIARQDELNRKLTELVARIGELKKSKNFPEDLALLRKDLENLTKSLDLLENRLGEIASLMPAPAQPQKD